MYRTPLLLAFLALSVVLAGCSPSPRASEPGGIGTGEGPGAKRGTIAVSVLTLTNPFFKVIADTITEEAASHGYDVVVVSGEFDPARQQNQVKDFIVRQVSAIVLTPCDSKAVGPAIQEANAAGIPVFTADIATLAEGAQVVSHVATDNYQGGRLAGEAMIEALGEAGGKVAILDHKMVESCILRVKGFKEVIQAHNQGGAGGQIRIVAELPGGAAKDQGKRATEDILQAHSDIVGIFAINDPSALGASAALEGAGKADQVKIVAFDGQPEGKQAIKEGKIYADPVQFPDEIGRKTVDAIIRHLNGERVEPEILIPTMLYRRADAENDPELK
jgi:ribose transport system substrate-binding protein